MSSALSQLASKLSITAPRQQIVDGLRVLGFRSSLGGLRQVLEVSSSLNPQFRQLESIFPNAQKILRDFQLSPFLLSSLQNVKEIDTGGHIQSRHAVSPFCQAIGDKDFESVDFAQYPLAAELVSFFWLTHSCLHAQPEIEIPKELASLISAGMNFSRYPIVAEDHSSLFAPSCEPFCNGIVEWIHYSSSRFSEIKIWAPSEEIVREGFAQAVKLIRQISIPQTIQFEDSDELSEDDLPISELDRAPSLSERERLKVHHNSFRDSELSLLSDELRKLIEHSDSNSYLTDIGAAHPNFIEATIVTVALSTGRTIHNAIQFPLDDKSLERINLKALPGYDQKVHLYPIWERTISPNVVLSLPLPSFLNCLKHQSIRVKSATTLEDCLPYSVIPWETRCLQWLENLLSVSRFRIDRRIRDALAREIYHSSANPALLQWIASPIQKTARQAESLTYYLNPFDERTIDAYGSACTKLFKKYGAPKSLRESYIRHSWAISREEHRAIAQLFLDDVRQAEELSDLFKYHNALARYLLMLLIVATGHRKSYTPFHFPWDLVTEEYLVFISDKQSVGSEARYVPIPKWISDLLEGYRSHLSTVYQQCHEKHPELAAHIRQFLPHSSSSQLGIASRSAPAPKRRRSPIGYFFTINDNCTPRNITTNGLENICARVCPKGIRAFRKSVANALWVSGLSGHQIEAFLGHNGERHAFGESSSWSIQAWANTIRKAQASYIEEAGWTAIKIATLAKAEVQKDRILPGFSRSDAGYEGREFSHTVALAKVKLIIRGLLLPEWFDSDTARITDKDFLTLREAAKELVASDPKLYSKVNQVVATQIQELRQIHGRKIAATIGNMTRTGVGPIDISSSRYFAIASCVRSWWQKELGNYSQSDNYVDRIAAIGISLIVFDAVLDKTAWESTLLSIIAHRTCFVSGCLNIRSEIRKHTSIYSRTVLATPLTSAQIIGFERLHHSVLPDDQIIKTAIARINRWLKAAPFKDESLTLNKLIKVFSTWWQIRLPGCIYSIAIGNHAGPAPDELSETALYGFACTEIDYPSKKDDLNPILDDIKSNPDTAIKEFHPLLRCAEGRFELMQQTTRRQRKTLYELLLQPGEFEILKKLSFQIPIVSIMLGFLQDLLDNGGKKVDRYAFNSIKTCFSRTNKLIEYFWDKNIDDLESGDYDEAYLKLMQQPGQYDWAIGRFHEYMRRIYDAPNSAVATSLERSVTQCRSSLILRKQFAKAWFNLDSKKDDGQLIDHTKTFMSLCDQYALRTKEAVGLSISKVLSPKPFSFLIERNRVRDLKTRKKASLRVVSPLLKNEMCQTRLASTIAFCQKELVKESISSEANNMSQTNLEGASPKAGRTDRFLFSDTSKKGQLYSLRKITQATTVALRASTGNLSVVPYSMRHTAATKLAHFSVKSPRQIPISGSVDTALGGGDEISPMNGCFLQGFSAWPFWFDRVGMFLGHSSADTLLNTYWHSSHVRLAEYTWHVASDIQLTSTPLASMLGLDRSVVSRRLQKSVPNIKNGIATAQEDAIAYYVNHSKIPSIDCSFAIQPAQLSSDIIDPELNENNGINSWLAYDRLLCWRLSYALSISEMLQLAEPLSLPNNELAAFAEAYQAIVIKTGITDFEPPNSELTSRSPRRNKGVTKGSDERQISLSVAQKSFNLSEKFADDLTQLSNIWADRINPRNPWFVATSKEEAALIIEILERLGVSRTQLQFSHFNFNTAELGGILSKTERGSIGANSKRFSYGHDEIKVSEFGIRVDQESNSSAGDYRDTHRLMLILTSIIRAKNK